MGSCVKTRLWFEAKGLSIPYPDIVIAASALKEAAILVHADSHFDSIARHTDLTVESLVSLVKWQSRLGQSAMGKSSTKHQNSMLAGGQAQITNKFQSPKSK